LLGLLGLATPAGTSFTCLPFLPSKVAPTIS
jgi:hypothetical protein